MLRRVISFSLHQPLLIALLTFLFIACGIACFKSLPIEAFPDVSDTQVTVISLFPGHASEEVEKQVTVPMEVALSGIPNCVRLLSHTQFGLSFIILTFNDKAGDYFARQQVIEHIQGVELPAGVVPQLAPLSTAIGEIYRYRLQGDSMSVFELRAIEDWVVERNFKLTPGVADVVSMGGLVKQYQVNPNPLRMKANNVTLEQLFQALGRGNSNAGGNTIEQGEQQYLIRGIGLLQSSDDIGNIVITQHHGVPVLIRNVASVSVGALPRQGVLGQDQDDDIVVGTVLMRKGENPSDVLHAIKETVARLNSSILPKGVQIVPYYDRTWLIHTTLKTVFENLAEGAVLVMAILYIFLSNARAAGIVALMIPLALLATFIGLTLRGIPANLLSLGAMDFGIVVDGAVIVMENVLRSLSHRQPKNLASVREVVFEAAAQVGRPTFFSMLIIIVAHIPIFTLQRHEGRIFAPMAYTVTSALIGSLAFSLTLVPLLCFFLLRHANKEEENRLMHHLSNGYRPLLRWVTERPRIIFTIAIAALIFCIGISKRLGSEFLPELNEGTLWVNVMLPSSVSVSAAVDTCARLRAAIHSVPEVATVISKAGRPEDGTDPKPINMVEIFVGVKPKNQWRAGSTYGSIADDVQKALGPFIGIGTSISQPIRDNILESISQIDGQIVIKVFGDDNVVLREKAHDILSIVKKTAGVSEAAIDREGEVPQLQIKINRWAAARYGLNVADIQDVIETALGGKQATEIWEGEKRFDVVVRLSEEERKDISAIRRLMLDTPSGSHVPLEQVADISLNSGFMNIMREGGKRCAAIGIFLHGRDMGSAVSDMQTQIKKKISLPQGYFITWSGEFENQQRAMKRLSLIVPVSVFMIFLLLFNAFGSIRSAFLILANVPFALMGGILSLWSTGIHLSVSAAIGFIALFGQAVLNGVVMVSNFNELRNSGLTPHKAVLEGAPRRLRTVLMTTLLAMLGLLPMALSHGIGSEVQRPLAVVIIGGLFSATILTLLVLPALYLIFAGRNTESEETA